MNFYSKVIFCSVKIEKNYVFRAKNPENPYNSRHNPYISYNPYNFLVKIKKSVQSVTFWPLCNTFFYIFRT